MRPACVCDGYDGLSCDVAGDDCVLRARPPSPPPPGTYDLESQKRAARREWEIRTAAGQMAALDRQLRMLFEIVTLVLKGAVLGAGSVWGKRIGARVYRQRRREQRARDAAKRNS